MMLDLQRERDRLAGMVDTAEQREATLLQHVAQLQQRLHTLDMALRWQIRQMSLRLDAIDQAIALVQAAGLEFGTVQFRWQEPALGRGEVA